MALAASTGSPSMKAIAVGPLSSGARSEKPTESAARFVRVFLTTAYVLPAPRERRSSVSCATVSPRYSVSTAALEFWNRWLISSITAAFACVGMGLLSSIGRPSAGTRLRAIRARRRGTPRAQGAGGEGRDARLRRSNRPPARVARGSGTFDRTRTCDDQRSWGERAQEYTAPTVALKRSWRRDRSPE